MEQKDLQQIREVFRAEFQKGFSEIWEHNLEPAFDNVYNELQVVQTKLDRALYTELVHLEARVKRLEEKAGIKLANSNA